MKLNKTILKIPSADITIVENEVNSALEKKNIDPDNIISFQDKMTVGPHPSRELCQSTEIRWTYITIWYKDK